MFRVTCTLSSENGTKLDKAEILSPGKGLNSIAWNFIDSRECRLIEHCFQQHFIYIVAASALIHAFLDFF